jgi:hypothetical protein
LIGVVKTGASPPEARVVASTAAVVAVVLAAGVEFPQSDCGMFKTARLSKEGAG